MKKKEETGKKEEVKKKERSVKKSHEEINKILIDNFVQLQRVMSEQAVKMNKLTDSITNLLHLFEMSARSFMSSPIIADVEKDKEFLNKMDALLEQNKTIAKGLTLMEEKFRERVYGQRTNIPNQRQMTGMPQNPPNQESSQIDNIKRLPRF
ncbi:MAG: hypothetical protein ABH840_02375 [Nanoarchaeota archaeon]